MDKEKKASHDSSSFGHVPCYSSYRVAASPYFRPPIEIRQLLVGSWIVRVEPSFGLLSEGDGWIDRHHEDLPLAWTLKVHSCEHGKPKLNRH